MEAGRLPHVDHPVPGVLHHVDARLFGGNHQSVSEIFSLHRVLPENEGKHDEDGQDSCRKSCDTFYLGLDIIVDCGTGLSSSHWEGRSASTGWVPGEPGGVVPWGSPTSPAFLTSKSPVEEGIPDGPGTAFSSSVPAALSCRNFFRSPSLGIKCILQSATQYPNISRRLTQRRGPVRGRIAHQSHPSA